MIAFSYSTVFYNSQTAFVYMTFAEQKVAPEFLEKAVGEGKAAECLDKERRPRSSSTGVGTLTPSSVGKAHLAGKAVKKLQESTCRGHERTVRKMMIPTPGSRCKTWKGHP